MHMKRAAALAMAALLVFLTMFCVHAEETSYKIENGFRYRIEHTPDGDVLRDVEWVQWYSENDGYVPKTLGGIALTPDVLSGAVFYDTDDDQWIPAFFVDDDNPWFTVRNGALYTKDGKTAVAFPLIQQKIYAIPDGTQTIGSFSINAFYPCCVVFPDSVTTIADDAVRIEEWTYAIGGFQIAAASGSAAESYAAQKQYPFLPLGDNHTHAYFLSEQPPTCVDPGHKTAQCPCGDVFAVEDIPPDPDAHRWVRLDREDWDSPLVCIDCGVVWDDYYNDLPQTDCACTCLCHKSTHSPLLILFELNRSTVHTFVYCFVLFFWRLTGTHQYCVCGARHY